MKRYKKRSTRTSGVGANARTKYKSELEAKVAKSLGKNFQYESEVLHYVLPKSYCPDFSKSNSDGSKFYVEVKGWFRYEDQQKMRAVKFSNPTLDIRMFFPQDNKVQGSKMTNSQWCIKWGFPYAIGEIPKSWKR